jgi:hypothetical protein
VNLVCSQVGAEQLAARFPSVPGHRHRPHRMAGRGQAGRRRAPGDRRA